MRHAMAEGKRVSMKNVDFGKAASDYATYRAASLND